MEGKENGRKEAVETNVVHSGLFDTIIIIIIIIIIMIIIIMIIIIMIIIMIIIIMPVIMNKAFNKYMQHGYWFAEILF